MASRCKIKGEMLWFGVHLNFKIVLISKLFFRHQVIQRRQDDTVSFSRNFQEYKDGFGDLTGNFWLGLDKIASLCPKSAPCQFKVTMSDMSNVERAIIYNDFSVDSSSQYAMDTGTIASQTAGKYCFTNGYPVQTQGRCSRLTREGM